jgi:hypothetical protein
VGPEIFLALQAMRGAWSGIQYCCEALREGTVEIQKIKKTVEGGVADAKKIYAEVTGIWGWLKGLFGGKQVNDINVVDNTKSTQTEPVAKKKAKAKSEFVDHIPTQDEVVQQFIGHLGEWFDNYSVLKAFAEKRYSEVFGKDVIDQKEVLELTQLQAELDSAYPTLSTLMSGAPWQLGPIWTQFKDMQDKVKAGQAARQLKQKREKAKNDAIAAQRRSDQIDRNMTWFWSLTLVWYFWMLMGVVWLNTKTMQ